MASSAAPQRSVEEAASQLAEAWQAEDAKYAHCKLSLEEATAHLMQECEDNLGKQRVDNWVWAVNDELGGRGKKKVKQADIEAFGNAHFLLEPPVLDYTLPKTREAIRVVLSAGRLSAAGEPEVDE